MNTIRFLTVFLVSAAGAFAQDTSPTLQLAIDLAKDGDHSGAAVEFRRLALETQTPDRAGYFWASAVEYGNAMNYESADQLLENAEDEQPGLSTSATILRAQVAIDLKKWAEASFYLESTLTHSNDDMRTWSARQLAAVKVRQKDIAGAKETLNKSPARFPEGDAAIQNYAKGRDKNPWTGATLGLIPGFGYFYAGEWANGFRSMILNGLFLFGMMQTADDEQWGAFAVISFFELTWYSGSIYGGVDASHRYNKRRMDQCTSVIAGSARFEPDYEQLPVVALKFRF